MYFSVQFFFFKIQKNLRLSRKEYVPIIRMLLSMGPGIYYHCTIQWLWLFISALLAIANKAEIN